MEPTHGTYDHTARARGQYARCTGTLALLDKLFPIAPFDYGASTHNTRPVHTACTLWPCRVRGAVYACQRTHYVCKRCARDKRIATDSARPLYNAHCNACGRTTRCETVRGKCDACNSVRTLHATCACKGGA